MNVLILSPYPEKLIESIEKEGDHPIVCNDDFNIDYLNSNSIDFIVSYGYTKIINKEIIKYMNNSIINLHISYLPYNRGYYPNLWSHIEGTPSGVTIHRIDEGIDTGQILFRKELIIDQKIHTFESSYKILKKEIESLFFNSWIHIRKGNYKVINTKEVGTFHYKKEGDQLLSQLESGWSTNIKEALKILKINN
tara:strand:- start:29916 stop:30497 length:582 start_codon:yes stop_codon:yes gene_type:complete